MSSSIPFRKIGNTDVPMIGFGVMGLAVGYGTVDSDEERLKARVSSTTFWDTADIYGDSEELIGKWFKLNPDKRSKIFLATKFGARSGGPSRGDPEYVKEQFRKSLDRLSTDYIDLYYQHRVDPATPIESTVEAMAELVKAGKVKYLGLSECTPNGLRRANSVHPISALQIEYSAFERPAADLIATAREFGTKIVGYSPLGRGFLTGQVKSIDDLESDDIRRIFPKFQDKENFARILKLSDTIKNVGEKHGATAGQAALAWVLAQGEDIFVIPGTKKVKYLLDNTGAGKVHLTTEEVETILKAAEATDFPGARHPPGMEEASFVESPPLNSA
ncbi:hypothetical protein PQX77_015702 [Marasmius sp. AFHP31]|nr:hypothetical protein PQX77_015702 [Marasmius sp. AFHP31]